MKEKIFYYSSITTLLIAMFLICTVLYWRLYPFRTISFHIMPLEVVGEQFYYDEVVPIRFKFTKFTNHSSVVTRKFINSSITVLPDFEVSRKAGEYDFISRVTKVPDCLPPGKYKIIFGFRYEVNPIRTIAQEVETVEFVIRGPAPCVPERKQ